MEVIDSHVHYIGEDPVEYIEALLRRMDENEVDQCVLFGVQGDPSCSDAGVWHAWNAHQNRFIPFACSVRCELGRDAEVFLTYATDGPWQGVGELYVDTGGDTHATYALRNAREMRYPYYCPSDRHRNSVYREVFARCGERGMPVLVHCRSVPVMAELLAMFPETTFIWGHVDHALAEEDVVPLLDRHPNLYCEIGIQFRFMSGVLLSGEFQPGDEWLPKRFQAWQAAAMLHPTRIVWGSDIFQWPDLADPAIYRRWREVFRLFCEPLSLEAEVGIAGQNLLALLPRRG